MKTQQRKQKQEEKVDRGLRFDETPVVHFEADILAAEDFIRVYRARPLSPERELMLAVMEEAVIDYQRCCHARDKKSMERFANAEAWILEMDTEWIFSFVNCSEVLGIDPDYLREGLLRWKQGRHTRLSSVPMLRMNFSRKHLRHAA